MQLSDKSFDETEVEKDFRVRKKIKAIYNKCEAGHSTPLDQHIFSFWLTWFPNSHITDFPSLREYNDYQEMAEDLIQKLVFQTDVDKCNEIIQKYMQQNAESITFNKHKKVENLKEEKNTILLHKDDKRAKDREFQVSCVLVYRVL